MERGGRFGLTDRDMVGPSRIFVLKHWLLRMLISVMMTGRTQKCVDLILVRNGAKSVNLLQGYDGFDMVAALLDVIHSISARGLHSRIMAQSRTSWEYS